MKRNTHNISDQFASWGKMQHELPSRNHEMKQQAMARLLIRNVAPIKKPTRLLWLGLLGGTIAVCALISFLFTPIFSTQTPTPYISYSGDESADLTGASAFSNQAISQSLGQSDKASAVTMILDKISPFDSREFLETDYAANVQTRKANRLGAQLETLVRGHAGRINSVSISEKSGHLTFVLPKSSLDAFRVELGHIINPRFLSEQIKMKNRLSDKQIIEADIEETSDVLAAHEEKKKTLTATHEKTVATLQQKIKNLSGSIGALNAEVTTSTMRQEEIKKQVGYLSGQKNSVMQQLNKENATFKTEVDRINTNIAAIENELADLTEQDETLLNEVETVEGSIKLEWISAYGILTEYIPLPWLVFIVVGCVSLYIFAFKRTHIKFTSYLE